MAEVRDLYAVWRVLWQVPMSFPNVIIDIHTRLTCTALDFHLPMPSDFKARDLSGVCAVDLVQRNTESRVIPTSYF